MITESRLLTAGGFPARCDYSGRPIIPIITLLHEFISSGKGHYRRLVGKHTHLFCSRAVERSSNEFQKKILFVASAGADDFIARKLGVQVDKTRKRFFATNPACRKINPKSSALALRVYLSALMVILAGDKETIVERTGLDETQWLNNWCWVFDYGPEDKMIFNSQLITSHQEDGVAGLLQAAARIINTALRSEAVADEVEVLRLALLHDAAIIQGVVK